MPRDKTLREALARRDRLVESLSISQQKLIERVETVAAEAFGTQYTRAFDVGWHNVHRNLRLALVIVFRRHPLLLLPEEWIGEYLHTGDKQVVKREKEADKLLRSDNPSLLSMNVLKICRSLPLAPKALLQKPAIAPYPAQKTQKPPE